jgi:hypothetical protein
MLVPRLPGLQQHVLVDAAVRCEINARGRPLCGGSAEALSDGAAKSCWGELTTISKMSGKPRISEDK